MIDTLATFDGPTLGFLLADLGDVIGLLIPIVAVLFWVLNQIFGGEQAKAKQRRAQRPRPRQAAQPRPQAAQLRPQRQPAAGQVNDEVAEFLRRAAQKRGARQPADVEVVRPQPARLAARRVRPLDEVVATAEVIQERQPARPSARLSGQPAGQRRVSRPATKPASTIMPVDQADEKLEHHLHEVFDHQLGKLESRKRFAPLASPTAKAAVRQQIAETPMTAAGFAALLGSGAGVRQAIVLSEILQRPDHRW